MNKINLLRMPLLAAVLFFGSCQKYTDFGDTNTNPGGVAAPIPSALLSNVLATTIGALGSTTMSTPGYFAQYFSETQYPSASLYAIPQIDFGGTYTGPLYDLQNIINVNSDNNLVQAARILKAYIFWTVTDRWGDVPYSQALQGQEFITPVYDSQESIYDGLLAELTEAGAALDAGGISIGGDISSYGGSVEKWKKLANSLRLLISLQMSKKYPAANGKAATAFNAALADAGGVIDANADNFQLNFPGGNLSSPWYNLYNGRRDNGQSSTMTNIITALSDGRQASFASDVNGDATSTGVPYGWARERVVAWTETNANWAYVLNASLRQQEGAVVVIPAATVFLARSEAADRGWTSENAWTMLQSGVNASFAQWGVAAAPANYFTNSNVAFTAAQGSAGNIRQIALQRWLAGYPNGLEGWNIWRRTGFPALTPAEDAVSPNTPIPRRYTYATTQYTSNKANTEAAAGRLQGGDVMSARVWWDQ